MKSRIAVAIPGIAVAIAVIMVGGPLFAAVIGLVAMVAVSEYLKLIAPLDPIRWAVFAGAAITVALPAVLDVPERGVIVGVLGSVMLAAAGGLALKERDEVTMRVGVSAFGAIWIGAPLGLLVALRDLEFGDAAVANILIGTWAFDTFSYFGGRLWGSHPVAPRTSPKKTVEGLLAGVVGGVLSVWVAGLYMDWIDGVGSVLLGLAICVFAYVGDLFESLVKRDVGVKDSGTILAGHGGVLDRFDALLFTCVAGYFATIWLI